MGKRRVVNSGTRQNGARQKRAAKSQWKLWTGAGAVAVVLAAAILYVVFWYPVRVGSRAPDFTLELLNGQSATLSSFNGKPVLLSFWASG